LILAKVSVLIRSLLDCLVRCRLTASVVSLIARPSPFGFLSVLIGYSANPPSALVAEDFCNIDNYSRQEAMLDAIHVGATIIKFFHTCYLNIIYGHGFSFIGNAYTIAANHHEFSLEKVLISRTGLMVSLTA
jgi:hypothetical protein